MYAGELSIYYHFVIGQKKSAAYFEPHSPNYDWRTVWECNACVWLIPGTNPDYCAKEDREPGRRQRP